MSWGGWAFAVALTQGLVWLVLLDFPGAFLLGVPISFALGVWSASLDAEDD